MTTRRDFVLAGGAALAAAALPPAIHRAADHDLVIRGGTVFDGTGAAGIEHDVAISGGRITAVGPPLTGAATPV